MEYPKALMTISELVEMGYARRTLERNVHKPGFPARKAGQGKKAPWRIDTKEFEKWQIKMGLLEQPRN